jgi:hypothetical protein
MGISDCPEGIKNTERAGAIALFGIFFRRDGFKSKKIVKS